jgi:hypothetical protein
MQTKVPWSQCRQPQLHKMQLSASGIIFPAEPAGFAATYKETVYAADSISACSGHRWDDPLGD